MSVLPVVIIILSLVVIAGIVISGLKKNAGKKSGKNSKEVPKDRDTIIKESNKKLATNPKDTEALENLANIYFADNDFRKAMRTYQLLLNNGIPAKEKETGQIHLRYGISAMECEDWEEARKCFKIARSYNPGDFAINSNMGRLEFMQKNYSQAINYLRASLKIQPDNEEALSYMGQSLYRLKRYSEAAPYLRQGITSKPNDKESLYALARCLYETNQNENALKIFKHLRADPVWGPNASLYSGSLLAKKREWEDAILDYQLGMRHEKITKELRLELKYKLSEAFNQLHKLDKALEQLNDIYNENPSYKDVASQIARYRELNSNKNLQTYLLAPTNDFILLCHKIVRGVYPKAVINFNDANVQNNEFVDILAEVKRNRWEDMVLFRFIRTEGPVGELFVRDLYAHAKELHAGRGFCFTVGEFSPEAIRFAEARLIDLMDKPALVKLLKSINSDRSEGLTPV